MLTDNQKKALIRKYASGHYDFNYLVRLYKCSPDEAALVLADVERPRFNKWGRKMRLNRNPEP